jgi:hypothetical protein
MRTGFTLTIAACGLVGTTAVADPVIGNLGAPQSSSTVFGTGSTSIFKAAGFTMGAGAYFLDSVTLTLDMQGGLGNPVVSIWDGGSAPAAQLLALSAPGNLSAGGIGDFVFSAAPGFVLQANTTYWVHVASDPLDGAAFNWLSTTTGNPPAGPGASFVGYNFNGGPSSFYNIFQVNGTPVPAPAGVAAFGLLGLACGRRRR